MVNAVEGFGRGEEFIIEKLKETKQPVFLVINKIDQVHPEQLLELIDDIANYMTLQKSYQFLH